MLRQEVNLGSSQINRPVAGMDHVSTARLVLPVGGRRCDPESQQMLRPWAGPPVFRPDNGSGVPDFGPCH